MVTQWAKTAFLSGLRRFAGGTLTVECPDRTYRFGDDWRARRDARRSTTSGSSCGR